VTVLCTVNAIACAPVIRHGPESQPVTWPVYLGSPAHDIDATERLDATPKPAWRANPGREIRGAAAAGKGVLAVGTTDRVVALLGTDSGQVLWDRRLAGTIRGGPLLTDNRVYVATEETPSGRVYALEMRTGKTVWDEKTGGVAAAEDGSPSDLDPALAPAEPEEELLAAPAEWSTDPSAAPEG